MKHVTLKVLGMDPSLRNWGMVGAHMDLRKDGSFRLHTLRHLVVQPKDLPGKQVRQNAKDVDLACQLFDAVLPAARAADLILVEVPVGSQNSRSMVSYAVAAGLLGALQSLGISFISVTPAEVKKTFTGDKNASKEKMIQEALRRHPDINFPMHAGKVAGKAEHIADALAAIYAGAATPLFLNNTAYTRNQLA